MKNYKERVIEEQIRRKLHSSGGILLRGPRYVGKTTTALRHSKSSIRLDASPEVQWQAETAPLSILRGNTPRLIDEWQLAPNLWNVARSVIDHRNQRGQFIFTGSAIPDNNITTHTGAGRFSRLYMRPMSLYEKGISTSEIPFSCIFEDDFFAGGLGGLTVEEYFKEIIKGGWPALLELNETHALESLIDYVDNIANVDLQQVKSPPNPERITALMRSLSRNISTEVSYEKLSAEALIGNGPISVQSVRKYLDQLTSICILEKLPAWRTHIRSNINIRIKPKWHFIDPSLATATLRLSSKSLLHDLNAAGLFFESLAIRDLRIYAGTMGAKVFHYRDATSLEIDAIVERYDEKWIAFEVKIGGEKHIEAAISDFAKLKNRLTDEKLKQCAGFVVLTAGRNSYTRKDGVHIISLGHLCP
ncbi:MAG: DUF4143 domain-containing protein [Candidatus Ancillula sp.]|jgi:predicted AAA+ superfamily ATPase|nr:DUF4143 domain-containing protein [Candidatus Ancillula sp.]